MKLFQASQPHIIKGTFLNNSGMSVEREYAKGRFLGKGGFAECYEFKDLKTGEIFAAKIVSKSSLDKHRARQKLESEIKIQKSLRHPGIVRFEGTFEDDHNVYILLELCENKSLRELLSTRTKLTELEVQCYIEQLVKALQYVHGRNIIHRDIKLRNLFLGSSLELKVGDFGLSANLKDRRERRKTICGTPNYMAPEILDIDKKDLGHSFEVDIWAIGIVLYTLLIGIAPFDSSTIKQTYRKILKNQYTIPSGITLSNEAINLIKRILAPSPEDRPTLEEILEDPFMIRNPYPRLMPLLTLASSPSQIYLSQYVNAANVTQFVLDRDICELKKPDSNHNFSGSTYAKSNICLRKTRAETELNLPGKSVSKKVLDCTERTKSAMMPVIISFCKDYLSQYGMGYHLTDGTVGFFYNDSSNLLLTQDDRYNSIKITQDGVEIHKYKVKEYPKELLKKVKIFEKFKELHNPNIKHCREESVQEEVFIRKLIKTNVGILVKLSNQTVQMIFKDKWQVVVCLKSKLITTVNEKGDRNYYKGTKELKQTGDRIGINKVKEVLKTIKLIKFKYGNITALINKAK